MTRTEREVRLVDSLEGRWIGWAFLTSAILMVVGHTPPPLSTAADAVQALPMYVALVGMAVQLIRSSADGSLPARQATLVEATA